MNYFIDMDGTLARFYEKADCLERMNERGFFESLNRYENVCEAVKKLAKENDVYFITSVHPCIFDCVCMEKMRWLRKQGLLANVPDLHVVFCRFGKNKAQTAALRIGKEKLTPEDILLDDYNKNLEEWMSEGGRSVKLVNEINDRGLIGPLWVGYRVRYDWSTDRICMELKNIGGNKK